MAPLRCYDNSDVIATLIITNFPLYLIQQWCQFFQIFVYGDVVYAHVMHILISLPADVLWGSFVTHSFPWEK